ncbi:hypothetical protein MGYG_07386 [Nannizzia gypsea CBS 118893]|uniref:Secreted protein n=1 Tax=Arthroderma gypseum (strain ATCC MYA-4604 / CBS 118893) TaxID=535722 RepID=E4V304_ARTGP|nr:hypothetical protein MGYG_07386 [Nannizzia gypsea CBS 118893]EFR04378.1 hypothetical protein MGYG_07386 [Nannizzia gypsea CBS 118893]
MHFFYILILCFLSSLGHARIQIRSKNPTSIDKSAILPPTNYVYKTVSLKSNYTILDDLNHDSFAPGAGGVVEIKGNNDFQWSIEHISNLVHIVGYKNSSKYIHFPELKDGAVATFSEYTATFFNAVLTPNLIFNFTTTFMESDTGPLMWTVEAYSDRDPRKVLKLRKPESGNARQRFVLKKAAIQDN